MKTIEERAEYYERRCVDNANALGWCELPRPSESYKQGAEEQRKIDIDKACKWLKARNVLTDASLEGFRQAMDKGN